MMYKDVPTKVRSWDAILYLKFDTLFAQDIPKLNLPLGLYNLKHICFVPTPYFRNYACIEKSKAYSVFKRLVYI